MDKEGVVLVCGGREYSDRTQIHQILKSLPINILIQGGARGADHLAKEWAESNGIHTATVNALWNFYGKSAGYKRNAAMLLLKPTLCVAFPGGRGTAMMVVLCKQHEIPVITVEEFL